MKQSTCIIVGAPVDSGKRRCGCMMGPDAYRTAGLGQVLNGLGMEVEDMGNLSPADYCADDNNAHLYALNETIAWTESLSKVAEHAMGCGKPIFLGGDHSMSLGTLRGVSNHAAASGRPQFVLWLDAHSDFHTPDTTHSGNLHGTPLGYATGRAGFDGFPNIQNPIAQSQICMLGLRSVDRQEQQALEKTAVFYNDMRSIDENGIARPLTAFLSRVVAANGLLHVSLDVDFLDPMIAPAVGTTVPGGATMREAHLVMEILHDSNLVTSMDLAELNPFLDERGRTAQLMVDLTASAFGRRTFDRPTRVF